MPSRAKSSTNAEEPLEPAVPLNAGTDDGLLRLLLVPTGPPTEVPTNPGTEEGLLKLEFVPRGAPTAVPVKPGTVDGVFRFEFGAAAVEPFVPAIRPEAPAGTAGLEAMVVLGPAPVAVVAIEVEPIVVLDPTPVLAGVVTTPMFVFGPAPRVVVTTAGVSVAGTVATAVAAEGGTGVGFPLAATLVVPTSETIPLPAGPLTAAPMISS